MDLAALVRKYSKPGPRYTSYPTAPQWTEQLQRAEYAKALKTAATRVGEDMALYVHIPFCESLCYYCGCNIQITRNHDRAESYLTSLCREMDTVGATLGKTRPLTQISWGGGTPTFLSSEGMKTLFQAIERNFEVHRDAEISIEVDPRVTSDFQLTTLRSLGFNRISLGVQDFDPRVQQAVNRVQSAESTEAMLKRARELGFSGINFDFIYGLPFQTEESFHKTVEEIVRIRPDRIALYNYAHLPSLRPHQKILEKFAMPDADERLNIFSMAYEKLLMGGYRAIGMDHFALESDEMYQALESGKLYRNFMGYTVQRAEDMLGFGCSAIGEFRESYFQNIREPKAYESSIEEFGLSMFRGCLLTDEDLKRKWVIQQLMCRFQVKAVDYQERFREKFEEAFAEELTQLSEFESDGILERNAADLRVTPLGRLFVRNVAMVFDAYLKKPTQATYSKTL